MKRVIFAVKFGALLFCDFGCLTASSQTVLWTYDAGSPIISSPTLGADGTVYLSSSTAFVAVTNAGSISSNKWTSSLAPAGSASIGADGTIYLVDTSGNLSALASDGATKWTYAAGGGGGTPALGADGTIYFQSYTGLLAISPYGSKKWKAAVGDSAVFSSPGVGPDGTVYMTSSEFTKLYAIGPDGTQKWVYPLASKPGGAVCISADGTIYVSAGPLYAFSPDGTNLWSASSDPLDGLPVMDKSGVLYVGGYQSHLLYAFTPDGKQKWQTLGYGSLMPSTAVAVDAGGTIYYCIANALMALNAAGSVQWSVGYPNPRPGLDVATTSPIIGTDGTIYAALGNLLFAISSGTNGPAKSSWPMYQQNVRHTGKVERPALKQPQKRSDANFQFQLFPQQLGISFDIEMSTNLNTWTSLTSIVATALPTDVADLTATNAAVRFYRAVSSQ